MRLPAGPACQRHITADATEEIKLDGYRAIGVKASSETVLYSRNHKNFNKRFPQIAKALADLPADTVIDGEVVALDESGRPDFHRLQHFTAEALRIRCFVFDLIILRGRDLTSLPLSQRRELMKTFKPHSPRIRLSEQFHISADDIQQRREHISVEMIYELADTAEAACEGVAARLFPFSDPLYSLDLMSLVGVSVRPILRLWVA